MTQSELDLHYPPEKCPFCTIANAYPLADRPSWQSEQDALQKAIPGNGKDNGKDGVDPEKTSPASFVVLASRDVVAFLDILPMVGGHLLVATRNHRVKVADMLAEEAREMGFWLPLLSKTVARVTGVTDYNIVQNNGARAAQVVPHVHFHIIPRPGTMPEIKSKSWTMFGRGQRDELDEEEGAKLAGEMRRVLREEVARMQSASSKL